MITLRDLIKASMAEICIMDNVDTLVMINPYVDISKVFADDLLDQEINKLDVSSGDIRVWLKEE